MRMSIGYLELLVESRQLLLFRENETKRSTKSLYYLDNLNNSLKKMFSMRFKF